MQFYINITNKNHKNLSYRNWVLLVLDIQKMFVLIGISKIIRESTAFTIINVLFLATVAILIADSDWLKYKL